MLYDGDIIEHDGARFRVEFPFDDSGDTPWDSEDGHGPVSDWRNGRYTKTPGERELCSDHGQKRFYDFAEACRIALKDGWLGSSDATAFTPYMQAFRALADKPTGDNAMWAWIAAQCEAKGETFLAKLARRPKMRAARAAESDFDFLSDWCNDRWQYVGVVVELVYDDDEPTGETESVWGIESCSTDYLEETAHELAGELLASLKARAA